MAETREVKDRRCPRSPGPGSAFPDSYCVIPPSPFVVAALTARPIAALCNTVHPKGDTHDPLRNKPGRAPPLTTSRATSKTLVAAFPRLRIRRSPWNVAKQAFPSLKCRKLSLHCDQSTVLRIRRRTLRANLKLSCGIASSHQSWESGECAIARLKQNTSRSHCD